MTPESAVVVTESWAVERQPWVQALVTLMPGGPGMPESLSSGWRGLLHYAGRDFPADFWFPTDRLDCNDSSPACIVLRAGQHRDAIAKGMPFVVRDDARVLGYGVVTGVGGLH
ncbi:MAG TPA: hypothetical protein VNN07_18550 [Candidatus Tectomicrobia bacterium]|nr:hypothetical protein [Candidatus Tectomicrobia bacterium]